MFYWVLIKPMWEHTEHKSSIFKPFSEAYPGPLQTSIVVDVEQVNVSWTEASPGTLQTSKMESFAIIYIICIDIHIIAKLSVLDVCRVPGDASVQLTFTCSKSTTEPQEKGVKYISKLTIKTPERRLTSPWCFYC